MAVDVDAVKAAARRLDDVVTRTPVVTSSTLDSLVGGRVLLKVESFQRAGSFKIRGAYNRISQLGAGELTRGVAAYSSGNHAQAVALAARLVGTQAVILMPEDAPPNKVQATRGYGAEIVTYDRYTGDRDAIGRQLAEDRGAVLVPPYDHPDVIAGQGTVALELLDDVGEVDTLVVPVGGGGLISGCAVVAAGTSRARRIVGVEPAAGDDTKRSLEAGHRVAIDVPRTIADGQQGHVPGELTFPIIQKLVDDIVLVGDDEIVVAMKFLFERMKVVVEPSGASALAAVLNGSVRGGRLGVVLSGGNVAVDRFAALVGRPGARVG